MAIPPRILKQLGHPSGLTGRLILRMLNRVNKGMNGQALMALDICDRDKVLELGFGGGSLISDMLATRKAVQITGSDISKLAVQSAQKRFRAEDRVSFEHISGEDLPYEDAAFGKVVCVNVIYFWQDVPNMLREIFRVLEGGGRVVLCYSEFGPDEVSRFKPTELESQLRAVGFATVRSSSIEESEADSHYCTVGFKASAIPAE